MGWGFPRDPQEGISATPPHHSTAVPAPHLLGELLSSLLARVSRRAGPERAEMGVGAGSTLQTCLLTTSTSRLRPAPENNGQRYLLKMPSPQPGHTGVKTSPGWGLVQPPKKNRVGTVSRKPLEQGRMTGTSPGSGVPRGEFPVSAQRALCPLREVPHCLAHTHTSHRVPTILEKRKGPPTQ